MPIKRLISKGNSMRFINKGSSMRDIRKTKIEMIAGSALDLNKKLNVIQETYHENITTRHNNEGPNEKL
jgi:hypothetical protein